MNWTGLAGRLERKYGLGEVPFASRKTYRHVERLCHVYGDAVYTIVRDMADYCDRCNHPGRTFRKFVLIRIAEHGYKTGVATADAAAAAEAQAAPQVAGLAAVKAAVERVGGEVPLDGF